MSLNWPGADVVDLGLIDEERFEVIEKCAVEGLPVELKIQLKIAFGGRGSGYFTTEQAWGYRYRLRHGFAVEQVWGAGHRLHGCAIVQARDCRYRLRRGFAIERAWCGGHRAIQCTWGNGHRRHSIGRQTFKLRSCL